MPIICPFSKEVKIIEQLDPDKVLAMIIHTAKCRYNHTDECSWYCEMTNSVDDWNGYSHKEYLTKSRKFIAACNKDGIDPFLAFKLVRAMDLRD